MSAVRVPSATDAALVQRTVSHVDAYLAHPDLPASIERVAIGLTAMFRGQRLLNRVLSDRGRLVFGMLVLYLHATPDEDGIGLTVTRIAKLCHDLGVCSRGRAKALIVLMRWAGYVEPGPLPTDTTRGRRRPLVPTERLLDHHRARWRLLYGGLAEIDPAARDMVEQLDDPQVLQQLLLALIRRFQAGFRIIHFAPEFTLFAERDAGIAIALTLACSGEPDDLFPPKRPFPVSVAALSSQFLVSRAHVLKVLREAEAGGLIQRTVVPSGNVVTLNETFRACLLRFIATGFSALRDATDEVMAARAAQLAGTGSDANFSVAPANPLGTEPRPAPPQRS